MEKSYPPIREVGNSQRSTLRYCWRALCRGHDNPKDMEQRIMVSDYNEGHSGVLSAIRFVLTYGAT